MHKGHVPPELEKEYGRVRNIGALIDVVLPLAAAISLVIFANRQALSLNYATEGVWLGYGLVAFSVTVCLVARIVHQRLMDHVKRLVSSGHYRRGKITYSYIVLFALYLCPAVWGFGYYLLTGRMLAAAILVTITALSFLFLTPTLDHFFKDQSGQG